ncbi:MAG: hypothetical protein ABJC74_02480 [Gemmatimonadota bacterium]
MTNPAPDQPLTFLLSPAHLGGVRGGQLLNPAAGFPLAQRLHGSGGATLGELFSFVSALYFRGKLAYASRFAPPAGRILVITSNRGLLPPSALMRPADLAGFGAVDIDPDDPRYADPLRRDLRTLPGGPVLFLGSLATPKYLAILEPELGARLLVPGDFAGLGDMSRGSRLLRAAAAGQPLAYRGTAGRSP